MFILVSSSFYIFKEISRRSYKACRLPETFSHYVGKRPLLWLLFLIQVFERLIEDLFCENLHCKKICCKIKKILQNLENIKNAVCNDKSISQQFLNSILTIFLPFRIFALILIFVYAWTQHTRNQTFCHCFVQTVQNFAEWITYTCCSCLENVHTNICSTKYQDMSTST